MEYSDLSENTAKMRSMLAELSGYSSIAGKENQLLIIAGPCVIESLDLCLEVGETMKSLCAEVGLPYVFKSSFDKANRSSSSSYRGVGLEKGLSILAEVKNRLNVPVTTDIHLPEQAKEAAACIDILQIPAFLARQTDLVEAAAATKRIVSIKRPQFASPQEMENIVKKVSAFDNERVLIMERGTCFGYNDLINDFRAVCIMNKFAPVVYDATHSAQTPGSLGKTTGGRREFIPAMVRAAVAVGVSGLFFETHPNPAQALSDAATQMPLTEMPGLLKMAKAVREVASQSW